MEIHVELVMNKGEDVNIWILMWMQFLEEIC